MMGLFHRVVTRLRYSTPLTKKKLGLGLSIPAAGLLVMVYLYVTANPSLHVVIVEEHHEVLPYWFAAATHGRMPSAGYTLAAVMTGLISRVIFVWPQWSRGQESHYTRDTVGLGYFMHKAAGASKEEPYFCECHSVSRENQPECIFVNFTANIPEEELPREKCQIKTTYISEHIIEDMAFQKLQSGKWIKPNESYILDIDEDFFGCESGTDPLIKGGISWKMISLLNKKLEKYLCPQTVAHEEASDKMLKHVLEILIEKCQSNFKEKGCKISFDTVNSHLLSVILEYSRNYGSMFCGEADYFVKFHWHDIALILYHMPTKHLKLLSQTGFCLSTSPATLGFHDGNGRVEICHGANTPNNIVVQLHSPSQAEIHQRMDHLSDLLASVPSTPEIVTVCRSVRDGYTPRQHSMMIEWGIVHSLVNTYSNQDVQLFYDKNLLGGRKGWYGR